MSFEIKYDRNGYPLPVKPAPVVQEQEPVQPQETIEQSTAPEESVEAQEQESIEQEEVQQPEEPVAAAPKESSQARNFRELREAKEREEAERRRAERERDELAKRLKEYEAQRNKPAVQQDDEDYNISINPDDLVEGKHLSKVDKKIKMLERKLAEQEQKNTLMAVQTRLAAQYPDFESVVSADNVNALKSQYPELAHTLASAQDPYVIGVSAYTMIKKLGIAQEKEQYRAQAERVQYNTTKPRPASTVAQSGDSPLSKANAFANGLTPDLQKQLLREMELAKKNY